MKNNHDTTMIKRNRQERREDKERRDNIWNNNFRQQRRDEAKGINHSSVQSLELFLEDIEINRRWAICREIERKLSSDADWEFEILDIRDYEIFEILNLNDELCKKRYWPITDICDAINFNDKIRRYEMIWPDDIEVYEGHEGGWQSLIDQMV